MKEGDKLIPIYNAVPFGTIGDRWVLIAYKSFEWEIIDIEGDSVVIVNKEKTIKITTDRKDIKMLFKVVE